MPGRKSEGRASGISERKRAEEALRFTQYAVDRCPDPVYWVGSDARIRYVNDAACRSLGYSREELLSMTVHDISPNFPAEVWPERWKNLKKQGSATLESSHRTKDGRVFPVEATAHYLEFESREYMCAFVRDISERKQAEEALRRSEELLTKTFASLNEAVFVVDPDTRNIIACNPAAERIFGYSEKEMMGRNTEFLHVDRAMYEDFGRQLLPILDADGVFHTEYQMRRKDGSVFLTEHTVTEIVDDSGRRTGTVSVVRDITERKQMEETVQAAREELEGKAERQMLRRNPYGLTFRELTVLNLVADGKADKEIGIMLGISPRTVQTHLAHILDKMGAASRTEAGVRALREGLLE